MTKYDPRKNAEGYNDPTPYAAEKHMMAQIRGKQARVAGGYFENIISASCDYYLSRGLAKIEKTPELLTIVDGMQLERYTKYLARWREIERELEKFRGTIVAALVKKETRQVMRLLWQESRLMDTALKQIEDGFGLSPKARVGLTVKPGEEHRNPLSASARKRG